jgi:hypothetical protein
MQVANIERLVLPKSTTSQGRSGRSPSSESSGFRNDRGGSVSRGNSATHGACVMATLEEKNPWTTRESASRHPRYRIQNLRGNSPAWSMNAWRSVPPQSASCSRNCCLSYDWLRCAKKSYKYIFIDSP